MFERMKALRLDAVTPSLINEKSSSSHEFDEPVGHLSRGDKTAIELFIAGIRGWKAGLAVICRQIGGWDM